MNQRPDYRVGYTLNDDLEVVAEVRVYVTDEKHQWVRDYFGHKAPFLMNRTESTWHSRQYFFKDDNHLLRAVFGTGSVAS